MKTRINSMIPIFSSFKVILNQLRNSRILMTNFNAYLGVSLMSLIYIETILCCNWIFFLHINSWIQEFIFSPSWKVNKHKQITGHQHYVYSNFPPALKQVPDSYQTTLCGFLCFHQDSFPPIESREKIYALMLVSILLCFITLLDAWKEKH